MLDAPSIDWLSIFGACSRPVKSRVEPKLPFKGALCWLTVGLAAAGRVLPTRRNAKRDPCLVVAGGGTNGLDYNCIIASQINYPVD